MSAKPAVAPVVATAVVVGVVNDDDGMVLNRAVPRGWTSGLCDCLNDCCSCFAVWCCTPITVAQLYVKLAYRGPESQAQVIFLAIASFLFARQVSEPGALLSPACAVSNPASALVQALGMIVNAAAPEFQQQAQYQCQEAEGVLYATGGYEMVVSALWRLVTLNPNLVTASTVPPSGCHVLHILHL